MRHLVNRRRRRQRGAVAVEAAIILPVLILLVFGIMDFGWMINRDTMVNNASREGAREGALNPDEADIRSVVLSSLSTLPPSDVTVAISCRTADGSACSTFAADAASGGTVVVRVDYEHTWITPFASLFGSTIALSKTTEMRIE